MVMVDPDWDFGAAQKTVSLALSATSQVGSADELFTVTNYKLGCVIWAIRPRDHVDLLFHIRGLKCVGLNTSSRPSLQRINGVPRRKLRVIFPPQHIAEGIQQMPLGAGACETDTNWGPMPVRMAQPSRLVFAIPDQINWAPKLRLRDLTDWAQLQPIVHRRAGIGPEITDQLAAAFPGMAITDLEKLSLNNALAAIAAGLEGPAEGETAIEMPSRLILSPSGVGKWVVPKDFPDADAAPIWTARLDGTGRRSVRAVWSTRLEPHVFPTNLDDDELPTAGFSMLSLSRRHHWEIVAQTSIYGLPGLRGLKDGPAISDDLVTSSTAVPRPTVVRPDVPIGFLTEIDSAHSHQYFNRDSGIALAAPFEEGDLSASALGGFASFAWRGDPPSLFWEANGEPIGLLLERLTYRGYLGRDTQVVAVEKAYLFPLGIRASLITVHERAIYPDYAQNPKSFLIIRQFIVTPKKPRTYPGPYQPFGGREFPPRRVDLKTLVTPDLAPIVDIDLVLPPGSDTIPKGAIFWPQAIDPTTSSDILFEWSTEDAASIRSKFIFVLNNVISRPEVMRALVDYYNIADDDRRAAWLGGARHRYAAPKREGDTSFDTTRWILAAQGRRDGPDGGEHFARDGRMEGADQPAFYPLMERGFVAMQNIEQMLGVPHGQVEVRYFEGYKRDGIDTKHQIFLTLGQSSLPMRSSARADRSGGVASPDLDVAAISRLTGPVGGSTPRTLASGTPDFGQAVAGNFDPKQFFGEAKLLGVVSLAEIVKGASATLSLDQAPRLLDETMLGARGEFALVQDVARGLQEALYGGPALVQRLEDGIKKADTILAKSKLSLQGVYPSLTLAMAPLRGEEKSEVYQCLKEAIDAKTAEKIRPPVDVLAPILRNLLDAVAYVIKDPVPDAYEDVIEIVRKNTTYLVGKADKEIGDKVGATWSLILGWVKGAFCATVEKEGFGTILFGNRGTLSCGDIFKDPVAALRGLAEGLYGTVFDEAWKGILEILGREVDLRARLDLALDNKHAEIASALRAGVALVAGRLDPYNRNLDDIRTAAVQEAFLKALAGNLANIMTPSGGEMSPKEALAFAISVTDTLPAAAIQEIKDQLDAMLPTIHASAEDPHVLLEELSSLVLARLERALVVPLVSEANALATRLKTLVDNAAKATFSNVVTIVVSLFEAVLNSSEIAAIGKAGRLEQGVCDAVGPAAIQIGDGVLATTATLDAAARAVKAAAGQIQLQSGPVGLPLRVALAAITVATDDVLEVIALLDAERKRLVLAAAGTACAQTRDYLDPLAAIIRMRGSVTDGLAEIARGCEAIQNEFAHGHPSAPEQAALEEIIKQCAALSRGLTGIDALAGQQPLLNEAIAQIKAAAIGSTDYLDRIDAAAQDVARKVVALRDELSGALAARQLRSLLEGEVKAFQQGLDRRLVAFLMQSVGFTSDTLTAMSGAIADSLAPFLRALIPIYNLADEVFERILVTQLQNDTLDKVYRLALGGDEKFNALKAARNGIKNEKAEVDALIANGPKISEVLLLINRYRQRKGALSEAVAAVEALSFTDVGQTLTEALREELKRIEQEVRALILQLVPTKLQTRYFWPTALKRFPNSDDGWIFMPIEDAPPAKQPSPPPLGHPAEKDPNFNWHLWIDSHFSFDFVTGKREVKVTGVLRPFKLRLLGENPWMLTISFEETHFTSVNGAAPDFAVKIKDVKLGTYLKFVESLQQWLSPQGSGFYLRAADDFPGIEVGYVYDAGMVQIGTLQFINVAFRVAAVLPFSSDEVSKGHAQFRFELASRDRPFLISCPPYGGGGWVSITGSAEGIEAIDLSFVFGGVAAIKFGPLNAQGRIVAGICVQSLTTTDGKKAHVITALFEAVGEGCIACFSICVNLRVALTQTARGALFGKTTYSFSFKVGFVRLSYSVSACYRMSNGNDPQAIGLAALSSAVPALIRTEVPIKESQWQSYRALFDLDLLESA